MKLKIYLDKKDMKPLDFAKAINVSERTIYRWITGNTIPDLTAMKSVERATGGKVKPKDFYD